MLLAVAATLATAAAWKRFLPLSIDEATISNVPGSLAKAAAEQALLLLQLLLSSGKAFAAAAAAAAKAEPFFFNSSHRAL